MRRIELQLESVVEPTEIELYLVDFYANSVVSVDVEVVLFCEFMKISDELSVMDLRINIFLPVKTQHHEIMQLVTNKLYQVLNIFSPNMEILKTFGGRIRIK